MYTSAAAAVKSLHLCPTLCDPIDGSPPGSSIPGILQARTLDLGCHFLLQIEVINTISPLNSVFSFLFSKSFFFLMGIIFTLPHTCLCSVGTIFTLSPSHAIKHQNHLKESFYTYLVAGFHSYHPVVA